MFLLFLFGVVLLVLWFALRKPKALSGAVAELEALEKELVAEAKTNLAKKDGV